jgi:nicotinamide riboside kinase
MGEVRTAVEGTLKEELHDIKERLEKMVHIKEEDVILEGPDYRARNKRAVDILKHALSDLNQLQNGLDKY